VWASLLQLVRQPLVPSRKTAYGDKAKPLAPRARQRLCYFGAAFAVRLDDIRRDPSRLLRLSIAWSKQRRSRMSEAMKLDSLARPNFGAVSRNHHAKANANEDAAQQGRVSEIN
jgi:hypothetical protein